MLSFILEKKERAIPSENFPASATSSKRIQRNDCEEKRREERIVSFHRSRVMFVNNFNNSTPHKVHYLCIREKAGERVVVRITSDSGNRTNQLRLQPLKYA